MTLRRLLLAFTLLSLVALSAPAQTNNQGPGQSSAAAAAAYPDTPEGLRQLLRDILAAVQAGENQKVDAFVKNLILPEHKAWFVKVFGPLEGDRLAFEYLKDLFEFEGRTKLLFVTAAHYDVLEVEVRRLPDTTEPISEYLKAILAAMKETQPLYQALLRKSGTTTAMPLGYFVYADGGFRRIGLGVLGALSTLPPPPQRIRVGGAVQKPKLIYKVQPQYPTQAKTDGIQGTVTLQAIITKDGTMGELKVLAGHPFLVDAAVAAVRQWRYTPTLLEGKPVEVMTTVDVIFRLSR